MTYPPIEVSEEHYEILIKVLAGFVFHRIHEGKYYVRADTNNSAKDLDYILNHLKRRKWVGFI